MDPFYHWEPGFGYTLNFEHQKLRDLLKDTFRRAGTTTNGTFYVPRRRSLVLCDKAMTVQEYRRHETLLENVTPTEPLYEARTIQWMTQLVISDPNESYIAIPEGSFYYSAREAITDQICSWSLRWNGTAVEPWERATWVAEVGQFSLGYEEKTLTVQLQADRWLTPLPEPSKTGKERTTCYPKPGGHRIKH